MACVCVCTHAFAECLRHVIVVACMQGRVTCCVRDAMSHACAACMRDSNARPACKSSDVAMNQPGMQLCINHECISMTTSTTSTVCACRNQTDHTHAHRIASTPHGTFARFGRRVRIEYAHVDMQQKTWLYCTCENYVNGSHTWTFALRRVHVRMRMAGEDVPSPRRNLHAMLGAYECLRYCQMHADWLRMCM